MLAIIFLIALVAIILITAMIIQLANINNRKSKITAAFALLFIGMLLTKFPLDGWCMSIISIFGLLAIFIGQIQLVLYLDKKGRIGALLLLFSSVCSIFFLPLRFLNTLIHDLPPFMQNAMLEETLSSLNYTYLSFLGTDLFSLINLFDVLLPVIASVLWLCYEPFKKVKAAIILLLINQSIWTTIHLMGYIPSTQELVINLNYYIINCICGLLLVVGYYMLVTRTSTPNGEVNRGTRSLLLMTFGLIFSLFILTDNDSKFIFISLLGIIIWLIGVGCIRSYSPNRRGTGGFITYGILMIFSLIIHFLPSLIGDILAVIIQIPAYTILSIAFFRFAGNDLFRGKNGMRTMGSLSILLIIFSIIYLIPLVGEPLSALFFSIFAAPIILIAWRNAIVSQVDAGLTEPQVETATEEVETVIASAPVAVAASKNYRTCLTNIFKSKNRLITGIIALVVLIIGVLGYSLYSNSDSQEVDYTLIPVRSENGLYGFMNLKGDTIIAPQFESVMLFRCGLAMVTIPESGKSNIGFINKKGELVIPATYIRASSFSDNIAWVIEENGAPKAIDKNGKTRFELTQAVEVYPFYDGLAAFSIRNLHGEGKLYGFVNKSGKIAIEPQYESVLSFHGGMATVVNEQKKIGFINKKGVLVIPFKYDKVNIPSGNIFMDNGQAVVQLYGKPVVIDKKGKHVIEGQFDAVFADGDDYLIASEGKMGWCDKSGKIIIIPQFAAARPFNGQKLAPASFDGKQYGYVDRQGVFQINPQFDGAACFINSQMACVKSGYSYGIIDTKGAYLVKPQADYWPSEFSRPESLESYSYSLYSDYVDVDTITNTVKTIFTGNLFDGMKMGTTIQQAMSKYSLQDNSFNATDQTYTLRETVVTPYFTVSVKAVRDAKHHSRVSDGWWGYNNVLNKAASLNDFILVLSFDNSYDDKLDYISEKLNEALHIDNHGGKIGSMSVIIIPSLINSSIEIYVGEEISALAKSKIKEGAAIAETEPEFEEDIYIKYTYKGAINDQYEIEMVMYRLDGNIDAQYRYTSNNKWISLERIYPDEAGSSMVLEERVDNNITGTFSGTLTDDEYSGTWVSADGSKSYPFSVKIVKE